MSDKLQIRLSSKSGELLNCINCFAGQISVFRAFSQSDLLPYQRALLGMPGPERVIVKFNDEDYQPSQHILIGFGEGFKPEDGTVSEFLISAGVPKATLPSTLLSFDLDTFKISKCSDLGKDAARRVRLLAATYTKNKAVILNNPFEPIASAWKERFAKLLLDFVKLNNAVVIITSLAYRPEVWIGNEMVARHQLGTTSQRTVGFASGPTDFDELVAKVRSEHAEEEARASQSLTQPEAPAKNNETKASLTSPPPQDPASPRPSATFSTPNPKREIPSWVGSAVRSVSALRYKREMLAVVAVLILIVVGIRSLKNSDNSNPSEVANRVQQDPIPTQTPVVNKPASSTTTSDRPETRKPRQPAYALDLYPSRVKEAVISAAKGRADDLSSLNSLSEVKAPNTEEAPQNSQESIDLLRENFGGGKDSDSQFGAGAPAPQFPIELIEQMRDQSQVSPNTNDSERREELRQKFLDAINRAREQQGFNPER